MPNWCENILVVEGPEAEIAAFKEKAAAVPAEDAAVDAAEVLNWKILFPFRQPLRRRHAALAKTIGKWRIGVAIWAPSIRPLPPNQKIACIIFLKPHGLRRLRFWSGSAGIGHACGWCWPTMNPGAVSRGLPKQPPGCWKTSASTFETRKDGKMKKVTCRNLVFDLGTFEGFNFRSQSAIERVLTAGEVVEWDHDRDGEAEFWPSGENPGVSLVFKGKSSVSGAEILALDDLLEMLGKDSAENFIRIYYAAHVCGYALAGLDAQTIEDENLHLFFGEWFHDVRSEEH